MRLDPTSSTSGLQGATPSAFVNGVDSSPGPVLVVQHDERNGPGYIADLPCATMIQRMDLDPDLPPVTGLGGVIVLGGPLHSYTDEDFPTRKGEIALLKDAVNAGIPVLGICLGAQLLAKALGARTYRRDEPEIGYLPVTLSEAGRNDRLFAGVDDEFIPRHKHFDSFELPEGAVRLASSVQCREQGFRYGELAWGLQFHFEMNPETYTLAKTDPDVSASVRALAPTAHQILSNFCSIVRTVSMVKAAG